MLSLLSFRIRALYCSSILAAAAFLTAGCGESIEDNPYFAEQQKIVARLDDESKTLNRQVEDISLSMATLKQDMREIRNNPQFAAASLKDFDQRLRNLETSIGQVQESLKSKSATLAKLEEKATQPTTKQVAAADAENSVSRGADDPAIPAAAPRPKKVQAKPAAAAPAPKPKIEAAKPKRGFYYQVQQGDTPQKIATAYRIGVTDLLDANRIPEGGRVLAGQRIYVPSANQ